MAKVSVLNMEGSEVGTIELSDAVFCLLYTSDAADE